MLVVNKGKDHSADGKQVFSYCVYCKTVWADQTAPDKRRILIFFCLEQKWYKGLFYLFCFYVMQVFLSDIIYCISVYQTSKMWL